MFQGVLLCHAYPSVNLKMLLGYFFKKRGKAKPVIFQRLHHFFFQCLPNLLPRQFCKLKYFVLFANFAVSGCFSHCRETNGWPTDQRLQERAVFQLKAKTQEYVQTIMSNFFLSKTLDI